MLRILTKNVSKQLKINNKLPVACFSTHSSKLEKQDSPRVLITGENSLNKTNCKNIFKNIFFLF